LPYRNYDDHFFAKAAKDKKEKEQLIAAWKDSASLKISPQIIINEFIGKYENKVYGYVEINKNEEELELTLEHHSKIKGKLEYIGNDRFLCTYSDPTYGVKVFPFKIEGDKVKSFDLYVDDFIDTLPYTFVKK